jgi:hypothetical protein
MKQLRLFVDRFHRWRTLRRKLSHNRWLRTNRVLYVDRAPDSHCIVRNERGPNK